MKTLTTFTSAMLLTFSALHAQVTSDIVGYETLTINPGANLLSIRVHHPVELSGSFETVTATTATDNDVDFSTIDAGAYVLELPDSTHGEIQIVDIGGASTSSLTLSDDIRSITSTSNVAYTMRKVNTLDEILGDSNDLGLRSAFNANFRGLADQIYILATGGGTDRYYYLNDGTLSKFDESETGISASEIELAPDHSVLVITSIDAPIEVVIEGNVKTTPSAVTVNQGTNLIGTNYPVDVELSEIIGLNNQLGLRSAFNVNFSGLADQIYVSDPSGGLQRYYYLNTGELVDFSTNITVDPTTIQSNGGVLVVSSNTETIVQQQELPEFLQNP